MVNKNNLLKNKIIKEYANLYSKKKKKVTYRELIALGYTKDKIRHHFHSLTGLDKVARETCPDKFYDIALENISTPKRLQELRLISKNCKRFVITTAVVGCSIDNNFYDNIKYYCKKNNAELLVLLAADPASVAGWTVDKKLVDEYIVFEDTKLNSNLFLSTIKLSAKHIDPITNLGRIGQRHGSFVYASPKQRLKMIPVSNGKLPHAIMTTGSITKPNYKTRKYMSERTAYIAEHDHVMGAIIVEIESDRIYHFRQIQSDSSGSFIDLGNRYHNNKIETVNPEVFVLGDWHSGEVDELASKCWKEVTRTLKPKTLIVHDAFNGLSINHHEEGQNILKAKRAANKQLDLLSELAKVAVDLNQWAKLVDKIVVVKSNHDEFLEKYLESGMYVKDPHNHAISLRLAGAMLAGEDPLKFGVELTKLKNKDKIKWLKRDEDYKVAKIQLGDHGDKGANGARGSLASLESAYGNCVSAHTHSPEILRGAWRVGTSSNLKMNYNVGPSSWVHTSCLVYPNGMRQLINVIEGEWRLK